ncbi:MAG: mechanosensitive ion channel [Leptospiraceae bacterium]|nr:mechanosensitive ion channel [Leptospiraceae bacterium]
MPNIWSGFVNKLLSQQMPGVVPGILISLVIIISVGLLRRLISKIAQKNIEDNLARRRFQRSLSFVFYLIIVLMLFPVWLPSLRSAATFLGIFGAGVLIVLKEIIQNLAGWIYITIRRPFNIGDRIQIGEICGDVIDIRVFEINLIEVLPSSEGPLSSGRIIHVPNNRIFIDSVINATGQFAFSWTEIPLYLTLESNWRKAEEIMLNISQDLNLSSDMLQRKLRDASDRYAIQYPHYEPVVFVNIQNAHIKLVLRILVEPRRIRLIHNRFWREMLAKLAEESDIVISTQDNKQ